jgi:hypothetical protein
MTLVPLAADQHLDRPGLGKASTDLSVHSAGYLAHDRFPYFSDTPAAPMDR